MLFPFWTPCWGYVGTIFAKTCGPCCCQLGAFLGNARHHFSNALLYFCSFFNKLLALAQFFSAKKAVKNIYQKTLQLLKGGMTALEKSYASSAGMLATHFRCDKNTIRYGGSTALQTVFTAYARAPTVRMMSKEHFLLMSVLDFVLTFLAP